MIKKNKEFKFNKINYQKLIFFCVFLIYFVGICAGCVFAAKNSQNSDFVKNITLTDNMTKTALKNKFSLNTSYIIRDIAILCAALILRYSGIQKSLVLCLPFILGIQNGCIYSALINQHSDCFHLLYNYSIKDSAIVILLLLYYTTTLKAIFKNKTYNIKDIKKLCIYVLSIATIYIIDYFIKTMIFYTQ